MRRRADVVCRRRQRTLDVTFLLGSGANVDEVRKLVAKYRQANAVDDALRKVAETMGRTLGAVQVRTPNAALDLLVNHWLLYQTIACRLWARAALYQAGGAYGFRDQLQDVMACVYAAPELARAQLLARGREANSKKETCSTGGIRPSGAARARGSRTIISGCRW